PAGRWFTRASARCWRLECILRSARFFDSRCVQKFVFTRGESPMAQAAKSKNDGARAHRMYVDGRWVETQSGKTYAIPNPATEEIVAEAPDATREDMRAAIAAARRAFDEGTWRKR